MTPDELGKINYDAYCDTRDWKAFNGDPLPQWPNVLPEIKAGWMTAATEVARKVRLADPAKEGGN